MFRKLKEDDYGVLRGPLESGRQSPGNLAIVLIIGIFLQALLYALEYFMAADSTIYPYKDEILIVHFWITVVLIVLSLIYALPAVFKRSEKVQNLLVIIVTQNMSSVPFLIMALFLIGNKGEGLIATPESLLNFTLIILFIGLLVFFATFIRFYILLQKGHYRKGSKKGEIRGRFETTSYISAAMIAGIGIVFVIQYIARNSAINDLNMIILIVGGFLTFFIMLFILPEQLVILYCKYRFKSFNFNERGYLNNRESL
ncbi:hypothetical protein [Psychrobacillus sp. FJAT-21963]|uniref:hypothetical protein n=1 Tax=Psychrobacillus sp. FJAT-21963 TaxID=1712028 RepID=UPI0006F2AAB3|nr:hypothetical protein [Psychrobacillus sp. FJAT-21963]KQL36828.1 hypothetical protein AN959_01840 [Psychrobacillus sp. FJAT-21963]